jgi:hypothetical protein
MRSLIISLVAAVCVIGLGSAAAAQDPAMRAPRVIELPQMDIFGVRQEPGGQYILSRSGSRYEVRELRESFVRHVVRSVDGEPF